MHKKKRQSAAKLQQFQARKDPAARAAQAFFYLWQEQLQHAARQVPSKPVVSKSTTKPD